MKLKPNQSRVEMSVAGIPCLVLVTSLISSSGNQWADSDMDYYGYEEVEYEVYDRKGYHAQWLEKKLDKLNRSQRNEFEAEVIEKWKGLEK